MLLNLNYKCPLTRSGLNKSKDQLSELQEKKTPEIRLL